MFEMPGVITPEPSCPLTCRKPDEKELLTRHTINQICINLVKSVTIENDGLNNPRFERSS
jgi:hypothetical protein